MHTVSIFVQSEHISMKWVRNYREKDLGGFVEFVRKNLGKNSEKNSKQDDIPAQIKNLFEMKEQGILTDEEFSSKKQELLAKLK